MLLPGQAQTRTVETFVDCLSLDLVLDFEKPNDGVNVGDG